MCVTLHTWLRQPAVCEGQSQGTKQSAAKSNPQGQQTIWPRCHTHGCLSAHDSELCLQQTYCFLPTDAWYVSLRPCTGHQLWATPGSHTARRPFTCSAVVLTGSYFVVPCWSFALCGVSVNVCFAMSDQAKRQREAQGRESPDHALTAKQARPAEVAFANHKNRKANCECVSPLRANPPRFSGVRHTNPLAPRRLASA